MRKTGKFQTKVPIYFVNLTFVAGSDVESIVEQRNLMDEEFGHDGRLGDAIGFVCYNGSEIGIFISLDNYTPGFMAHEVFHCACRIMERIGDTLTADRHEPHAYLVEWITDWIYGQDWDWRA